jgi:hypothetical protein
MSYQNKKATALVQFGLGCNIIESKLPMILIFPYMLWCAALLLVFFDAAFVGMGFCLLPVFLNQGAGASSGQLSLATRLVSF